MRPGKALESALGFACELYRDRGIAKIQKVDASHIKGNIYIKSNGSDFQGYLTGNPPRPILFEAKETHRDYLSLDEKGLKESQRKQLESSHDDGVITGVVIAFLPMWEVHWLDWHVVAEFVKQPYRASIPRAFCRAYGEECIVNWERTDHRPRVMFLDRRPHPLRAQARAIVEKEKTRAPKQSAMEPLISVPTKDTYKDTRTDAERKADIEEAIMTGGKRAHAREKQAMKWGAKARGAK